jgi:hypothetical protein
VLLPWTVGIGLPGSLRESKVDHLSVLLPSPLSCFHCMVAVLVSRAAGANTIRHALLFSSFQMPSTWPGEGTGKTHPKYSTSKKGKRH